VKGSAFTSEALAGASPLSTCRPPSAERLRSHPFGAGEVQTANRRHAGQISLRPLSDKGLQCRAPASGWNRTCRLLAASLSSPLPERRAGCPELPLPPSNPRDTLSLEARVRLSPAPHLDCQSHGGYLAAAPVRTRLGECSTFPVRLQRLRDEGKAFGRATFRESTSGQARVRLP
jgi:hypothetical protein